MVETVLLHGRVDGQSKFGVEWKMFRSSQTLSLCTFGTALEVIC